MSLLESGFPLLMPKQNERGYCSLGQKIKGVGDSEESLFLLEMGAPLLDLREEGKQVG